MTDISENKIIEFKQDYTSSFLKTVCAFANYIDGKIYFGIQDDGHIIGIKNINDFKLRVENSINDNIKPRPLYDMDEVKVEEKDIIVLSIYKGSQTPYYYNHQAYQRRDTASIPVDANELQVLVLEGKNMSYEQLPVSINNLEFHILEDSLKTVVGIEKISLDVLRSLGLYKNGKYIKAAELLADTNEMSEFGVDMVRFGDTSSIFLDRKTIIGKSLLSQYKETLIFFDQWYKPYEEIVGFYREKRIQIPREAFREALANAIIHRDFTINAAIRIAMYKNRIELTSPGALPRGISELEFKRGIVSVLRNTIIAEVFHRLGIIERFATGIHRIIEEYEPYTENPKFEIFENSITITLPCVSFDTLSDEQRIEDAILDVIKKQKRITRKEIQDLAGLKETKSKKIINMMIEQEKIKRIGQGRTTLYVLKDK